MILSYLRTVVLYLVLIFAVRLMGKRQIGEMEPAEFVVTMLIANLASIPMQDGAIPLYSGLVPILTVLGMELVLSGLILKNVKFRKLLNGKPVILINNGKLIQENLRRTRITLDELTCALREKNVLDVAAVQYAILETNGTVNVFPHPKFRPASASEAGITVKAQYLPISIVEDGYLSRENLSLAGKTEDWLKAQLMEKNSSLSETLLLTVDEGGKVFYLKKEGQP